MTTPRKWLIGTPLLAALLLGGLVLVNVRLDIYGLYRDTHGRHLPIYDSERRGKYLLTQHYVPDNFEALLLGSSVSSNWNTGALTAYRIYNQSTDGGNISEEKLLFEEYLRSRTPKAVIYVLHPYMTDAHGLSADEMNEREIRATLASTSLLRAYKALFSIKRRHGHADWDDVGTEVGQGQDLPRPLNPVLTRIMTSDGDVAVDPVALDELRSIIATSHARGVRLVAVVPPTAAWILEPHRARLDGFVTRMRPLFSPQDTIIDLHGPSYAEFRADRSNYRDGVHLSKKGADAVIGTIDKVLHGSSVAPSPPPQRSVTEAAFRP
jgi:hypothetical protein